VAEKEIEVVSGLTMDPYSLKLSSFTSNKKWVLHYLWYKI